LKNAFILQLIRIPDFPQLVICTFKKTKADYEVKESRQYEPCVFDEERRVGGTSREMRSGNGK